MSQVRSMSPLPSPRVRSPRGAAAAVERARLTVVAARPSSAPRAPFAVLVFVILVVGVVGLLMFNTHMQQASIYATQLEAKVVALEAQSQALNLDLERKRNPEEVAKAARELGMVTPSSPAFVNLRTGKIEGTPTPAAASDGIRLVQPVTPLPGALAPAPIRRFVTAGENDPAGETRKPNGVASPQTVQPRGTNGIRNRPGQGALR